MDKPHLVLYWTFDIPNLTLYCEIGDDLKYFAYEGGTKPFTKIHKGITSTVTPQEWLETERHWISEHYGELVGYFQPDRNRTITHPVYNRPDWCPNGLGPDGRYLDHLQRMQVLLEGEDMAKIWGGGENPMFLTPDNGKTIYKRAPTRNVFYPEVKTNPNAWWSEWPQPCAQQPYSKGPQLSSIDEMEAAGIEVIKRFAEKCRRGEWEDPKNPELQQWYIYPK